MPKMKVVVIGAQQQHFHFALRVHPNAFQSRPNDLRVVDDEDIARLQVIAQLVKVPMMDFTCLSVQHQQTGMVAWFYRLLGDQFLWQLVIQLFQAHRQHHPVAASSSPTQKPRQKGQEGAEEEAEQKACGDGGVEGEIAPPHHDVARQRFPNAAQFAHRQNNQPEDDEQKTHADKELAERLRTVHGASPTENFSRWRGGVSQGRGSSRQPLLRLIAAPTVRRHGLTLMGALNDFPEVLAVT